MNVFCTYCDQGYAARLLCLYESLVAQAEPFRLFVLCFDRETAAVVEATGDPNLVAIPVEEVLSADAGYAAARGGRSPVEFYFTSTPVLVRHCLRREPAAERMTYLDSDLLFFAPPSDVLREQGDASVGIVPHRFPPRLADLTTCGTYNVAWVSFRRDPDGLACLEWWRERCLEWCHDYCDEGRYADQGYLDEFPRRFRGVRPLLHPGINAAPWNASGSTASVRDGRVHLDDAPLLFYHFQGIREVLPGWFDPGFRAYRSRLSAGLRDLVYLPYLKRLVALQHRLRVEHGIVPRIGYHRLTAGTSFSERWHRFAVRCLLPNYRRVRGQLLHCPEPRSEAAAHPAAIPAA